MKIRYGLLILLLAVPVMGYGQSTLNFPKLFSPSELPNTGFAVVNPGQSTATVSFTLYSASGSTVSTGTMTIGAQGQQAKSGNELFSSLGSGGWVRATSTATGLQGFWLNYAGDLSSIDGAEAASTATDLVIPLVAGQTEVNVANPNPSTASVTLKLYQTDGAEMASAVTQSIAANGVFQGQASSIFPSANIANARYVRVTSSGGPIAAAALIRGFLVPVETAVVNGVDRASTTTDANFPHVINGVLTGANYTTVIGVTNLTAAAQTVTITFTSTSGSATSESRALAASGSLRETAQDLFNFPAGFQDGWVRVAGTGALTGFAAYGDTVAGALAVVPAGSAKTSLVFAHIADGPAIAAPWQTGLAFLNTGTTAASIEIHAFTPAGQLIGSKTGVALSGERKVADQLHNWVTQTRGVNGGFVFVRSNVPLYGIELFYTEDLKILSNVAAGGLAAGIDFVVPGPAPTLTSISPTSAVRDASVTLTGTGFSATAASNTVVFTAASGTVNATPTAATATSLTVTVPATAISGSVLVQTGGQSSSSRALEVKASDSALVPPNPVTVTASATATGVDIVVPAPAATLNLIGIGVGDPGTSIAAGSSSAEITRGQTKQLLLSGTGLSTGTTVSVSGSGVKFSGLQAQDGFLFINIAVDSGAAAGARNVIVTNSNLDTSILAGGLLIR
ncbi:MAG: IPT/TIG domain-containing protein [Acidobacteria bacterium]|nr:IPT/TIG domain-containing protein [Acidobacteriota bacterium]